MNNTLKFNYELGTPTGSVLFTTLPVFQVGGKAYCVQTMKLGDNFTLDDFYQKYLGKTIVFYLNEDSIYFHLEFGKSIRFAVLD